ncbi:lipopolysaccharide biosynthesis protein [Carnobacterium funditum]|uniref:lipopolysaccharide biosynthesis protein n=1 Tax=Carnobacterium funditum TaxID=2752 RepID=UPI0005583FCA|nr:oligosaccharide flippase family protein [Carnobacterium funditum]
MRTANSMKNVAVVLVGQVLNILLAFGARIVFVRMLDVEYLGVNGLFTDVLSILSLAELGFGSAVIYGLYKPLAVKDEKKIKALMNFYAFSYKVIGFTVLTLGLGLLPFLNIIIKDSPNIPNLNFIYLLYLANSVVTYFYAYKRSLIIADQKNYIVTFYKSGFLFLATAVQVIVLLMTRNFVLYLLVRILFSVVENIFIAQKANKLYPFLKERNKEKLEKTDRKVIFKNIKALMYHRVGSVVVEGTDNILISSIVGIVWVGLYSNYSLILGAINSIVNQIFESVTASVGNLNAVENKEKSFDIYKVMLFINFWIFGFCAISLWILLNPFITLWLGAKYVMSQWIVALIVINFYIKGFRKTTLVFKDAYGLFWNDRYKPIAEASINLIASLILARSYGIAGILLGTLISSLTTVVWIEPFVVYKNGFKKSVSDYFKRYIGYGLAALTATILTSLASSFIPEGLFINFIYRVLLCVIIPNSFFLLVFSRTDEFKYVLAIIKVGLKRKKMAKVNTSD